MNFEQLQFLKRLIFDGKPLTDIQAKKLISTIDHLSYRNEMLESENQNMRLCETDHLADLKFLRTEIATLRTKLARKDAEINALDALVEALERQADFTAQSARFALGSSWENEQYRGICQTTQSARAELDAIKEANHE